MDTKERIMTAYQTLLDEGLHLSQNNDKDYFRFRTEAMNLVRRSCGSDSDHYQELKKLAERPESATNPFYSKHCYGVLEAAKRDFESGLLFDVRSLIAADLLGDFMEQTEVLLEAGYHVPAASLSGAILEDTLRKLCEKHDISISPKTRIDALNSELARSEVYDKLVQKRITAIADIRNNADHGNFDKFSKDDVEDMVQWIGRFTADYLQ